MIHKITLGISIAALVVAGVLFFKFYNSEKIAYVDVKLLLDGYDRTEVERMKLNEQTSTLNKNLDSLMGSWQTEMKKYEKEKVSMTKKEKRLSQELLAAKQQKINVINQNVKKKIAMEDQKVTQTVINDINKFVNDFGDSNGYKMILGATGNGTLMYAESDVDLTDLILEKLNKHYNQHK